MIAASRAATDPGATPTVVSEAFLAEQGVAPWMELPLWISKEHGGMTAVSIARAVEAGFRCRPLAETIAETLASWREQGRAPREGVVLTREREAALLGAWVDSRS